MIHFFILFISKLIFERDSKAKIGHATALKLSLQKMNFYVPNDHD